MKALDLKVRWMLQYYNDPYVKVLVDEYPKLDELTYELRERHVFAEKDGYVHSGFIGDESASSHGRGYGGAKFTFKLNDGEVVVSTNVWSSCASEMHRLGFPQCVPISITTDRATFDRGHTFSGAHVTLAWLTNAIDTVYNAGAEYPITLAPASLYEYGENVKPVDAGGVRHVPVYPGLSVTESKALRRHIETTRGKDAR